MSAISLVARLRALDQRIEFMRLGVAKNMVRALKADGVPIRRGGPFSYDLGLHTITVPARTRTPKKLKGKMMHSLAHEAGHAYHALPVSMRGAQDSDLVSNEQSANANARALLRRWGANESEIRGYDRTLRKAFRSYNGPEVKGAFKGRAAILAGPITMKRRRTEGDAYESSGLI